MIYIFIYSTLPLVTNPCLGCARAWVGWRNKGRDEPRKEHFLHQPKARIEWKAFAHSKNRLKTK